nr:chemotaxis protein CheA [Phaeobacter inhibens]
MTPCAINVSGNDFGEDTYPMVQNNKVLTVSYGTFSCTLEGFDDSFGTMKAIAEYFRDLASDDRYFGAEPPQPDAEMLARIAQREVARQVEARTSAEGIHLRAATLTAPPAATPAPPADDAPPPRATSALAAPAAAPVTAAAPVEPSARRVEPAPAAPQVQPASEAPIHVAEVPPQEVQQTPPPAPAAEIPAAEPVAAEVETAHVTTDLTNTAEAEPVQADTVTSAESIAAKLRRIRAVVAKTPTDEFTEDQHAEQAREDAVKDITNALSADHDAVDADIADEGPDGTLTEAADANSDADIAEALNRLDLGTETDAPASGTTAIPNVPEGAEEFFADSSSPEGDDDTSDEDPADNLGDIAAEQNRDTPAAASQPEETEETEVTADAATPAKTEAPRKRGRVLRVKRREIEGAMASGTLEAVDDGTGDTAVDAHPTPSPETDTPEAEPAADSSLSPDDEAELLAELAAVEADLLGGDDIDDISDALAAYDDEEDSAAPQSDDTAKPQHPAQLTEATQPISTPADAAASVAPQPGAKRGATSTADGDIARLMAAADERLEDPENSTSRETYSQLRAVMAAASTERSAGGALESKDDAQVYRDDLASVVRPRRPDARPASGSEGRSDADQRPAKPASRPAPLKLVQEQRIDDSSAALAAPVRPRRVSAAILTEDTPASSATEGGFAAYAEESGAVELGELLEAAAAYMSFVEGRDHFSRPQLMNKVRGVDGTEFNREDGLRSFGQLLREGKIERADNGRFTASGQIGFQPGNRAVG